MDKLVTYEHIVNCTCYSVQFVDDNKIVCTVKK
jgi:hypothetical protein